MKYKFTFPLYICLATAVIGTTLLFWSTYFLNETPTLVNVGIRGSSLGIDLINPFHMYLVSLLVGISLLIPTWLALWLIVYLFSKTNLTEFTIRVLFGSVGTLLLYLTVYLCGGKDVLLSGMVFCYTFPLALGAYYFKLTRSNEVQT